MEIPILPHDLAVEHTPLIFPQHTWTPGCDGLHVPGPCPPAPEIIDVQL